MRGSYLQLADQGRNAAWRYLVGILITIFVWIAGSVLFALPIFIGLIQPESPFGLTLMLLPFGLLLASSLMAVGLLHQRPSATLIGPLGRISWPQVWRGFILFFLLAAIATIVEALLHPGRYSLNPSFVVTLPSLLVGLVLIPIQTSAEEVFFRGYLLQGLGRLTQNWLLLSVANGILFTLPHLSNPEAEGQPWLAALNWFAAGAFLTLVTLRSGSLNLALGIHAAFNLFAFGVAGYPNAALPLFSLFKASTLDARFALGSFLICCVVAHWLLFRWRGIMAEPSYR
ncbi:CPBP family intramembrane glutamic endopeptidase [Thermoleptolyngbya sp. PKUAC-SCTB121]|uniref:CPBP family intramembrane glutamic endopeptidase n=1 Tax=Thermoleptolyngbya sp. PKUAC-SCTB121 TaxID=2811482 RepID=UPI001962784B|nr:type II CAAX endopeptidase family protein [Thermoleptolyngbya sp. PKUAC-SCTB121]